MLKSCPLLYIWRKLYSSQHRRTGPFPFGGGHKIFCPKFVSLPEKSNMETTEGEGVGGGIPTVGTFLDFGVLKPQTRFLVGYIRLKITSTLAPNVPNDCSIKGECFSC